MATNRVSTTILAFVAFTLVGCGNMLGSDEQSAPGGESTAGACNPANVPFGGGSGSSSDPFLICSRTHWASMVAGETLSKNFLLASDVNFESSAPPFIDNFRGDFDGGNHALRGITTSGLFIQLTGSVRNLHLVDVNIAGGNNVGAIAGTVSLAGLVENVTVTGTIVGSFNTGGIAGVNNGTLRDVDVNADISGTARIGGVAGIQNGTLNRCFARGSVTASQFAGGLAGTLAFGGQISQSIAGPSTITAAEGAGGLVGDTDAGTVVADAQAFADVSGGIRIGGAVGLMNGILSRVLSAGTVTATGATVDAICGDGTGVASASFFDTTKSALSVSNCGQGKTTTELYLGATYVGWDLAVVWLSNGVSYPSLR